MMTRTDCERGAGQLAPRIEILPNGFSIFALQLGSIEEIILRIAVDKRGHIDDEEAFLQVGYIDITVHRMDRLLLIRVQVRAIRIVEERAWHGHGGGERRAYISTLAKG